MKEIYLDNSASCPPLPEVVEAMRRAIIDSFGNPSSTHGAGERARLVIETARRIIARALGALDEEILFTSGATESNNTVLRNVTGRQNAHVVTLVSEHSSVLSVTNHLESVGIKVTRLPVDQGGLVDLDQLEGSLSLPTQLVSVHWVNGETGVIQPIEKIAKITSKLNVPLHVDAAQAFGKLEFKLNEIPIDYLSISAHKIHGPQGVGAVYIRRGMPLTPLLYGGPQEHGKRAGTENLPGIAGFGEATRVRFESLSVVQDRVRALRDAFEERLSKVVDGACVNAATSARVGGISNVRFERVDGQALVARLDQKGIFCSQTSACTSARPEPSYVLRSMGLSESEAYASVRFAFSELITMADVEIAVSVIEETVRELRAFDGAGAFAA